jgi:hypothetical protein
MKNELTKLVKFLLIYIVLMVQAHAESKVTYAGEGRYTCKGSSVDCAQIDQNNRRETDYRERQYQREQDKAQAYVDRARRDEYERRNQQQK